MEPSELRGAAKDKMLVHETEVGGVEDPCCSDDRGTDDVRKTEPQILLIQKKFEAFVHLPLK